MHGLTALLVFRMVCASAGNLPNVSDDMLSPEFWLAAAKRPDAVIMPAAEIEKVNRRIHRAGYRIHPWREHPRVVRDRVVRYIESDLEDLTHWRKFDIDNQRMRDPCFSDRMRNLVGLGRIPPVIRVRYGLTVRETRVRSMPTGMFVQRKPDDRAFDILQNSVLDAGQAVVLYHTSDDGLWGYVQTPVCRGWVDLGNVVFSDGAAPVNYPPEESGFLVATGKGATVYSDGDLCEPLTFLSMGSRIPLAAGEGKGYEVVIPVRRPDGSLGLGRGYLGRDAEVSKGFLEFTPRNVATQVFRLLGEPYGWGGTGGSVDCSRFVANVLGVFGFEMPRTSFLQVKSFDRVEAPSLAQERAKMLDAIEPFGALLEFPGHIGLYLGKSGGRYYVIHSMSAYRVRENGEDKEVKVGRVVVSDLSLGEAGRDGSLFQRMKAVGIFRWIQSGVTPPDEL